VRLGWERSNLFTPVQRAAQTFSFALFSKNSAAPFSSRFVFVQDFHIIAPDVVFSVTLEFW